MTTRNRRNVLSRSFATFAAIVTLTTGIALTAAPSAAHAEVGDEFIIIENGGLPDGADGFMDYTDDVPVVAAPAPRQAGAASSARVPRGALAAPAGSSAVPAATTNGIIMRDGGVCDPIRHMGC